MAKYNLGISDRMILLSILPPEGDITTLKVIRSLKGDLGFNEEELERFGITRSSTGISWTGSEDKEIEIGSRGIEIIRNVLQQLNDTKKLTEHHIPLYELFVEPNESE